MKAHRSRISAWLQVSLCMRTTSIDRAILFGSVARGHPRPRDCDLALVATEAPPGNQWTTLRGQIEGIKEAFLEEFGFRLSVLLLTPVEWCECGHAIVQDALEIPIHDRANKPMDSDRPTHCAGASAGPW